MAALAEQLDALLSMSPAMLRQEWERVRKAPVPALPPELLRIGIAYRLQERAFGGLTRETADRVRRLAMASGRPRRIKPGTRLVRSWNGRTVAVLVEANGFLFEDRRYRSLSAIAREVTGAAWSGPRFFGLGVSDG